MMVSLILWAKWCDRGHYLTWRHGCFGEVIYAQCCSPPLTEIKASLSWRGTARFPSQANALENAHRLWPSQVRERLLAPWCWPASWPSAPFLTRRQRRRAQTYSSLRCFWFWSWLYIHSRVLGFACVSQSWPGPYSPSPTYPTATEFSNQSLVSWRANQYHFLVHPK